MKYTIKILYCILLLFIIYSHDISAQTTALQAIEKGGSFDYWRVREIRESAIIGGQTKHLYAIGVGDTIKGATAYTNPKGWVWSSSNVLAIVKGVTKTSCSVFPEKRGNGYCARLETVLETVTVLGLIDMKVLAAGTVYLGKMHEPIRNTKNPQSKLKTGIPFTSKPTALQFDYKAVIGNHIVKATGFGSPKSIAGTDYPDCTLMLQKRWEDKEGNVYAKRVGTAYYLFTKNTTQWVNGFSVPVHYGDITGKSYYRDYMKLIPKELSNYTINSKGVSVPIIEVGWAQPDETPTHIIIRFSSSHGEAYIGDPANRLWIDNINLTGNYNGNN